MSNERSNEEWNQMWMKLMQNELFIGKFWVKIVVEKWFYSWKIVLAIAQNLGEIWPLDRKVTVGISSQLLDQTQI